MEDISNRLKHAADKAGIFEIGFDKAMFRHRLLSWYDSNKQAWPWRLDWAEHKNPYTVWLSEIMLQQTVIKAVLPVYERFLKSLPRLEDLAAADEAQVRHLVRGLGYYRRFAFMHKAAKVLCGDMKPIVWPRSAKSWAELPGIGTYTSAAIASIAFNDPVAVVDGNVERVLCRLLDIRQPVNLPSLKPRYYQAAQELLASERPGDFNQAMMELGQRLCTPTNPRCQQCPVTLHCLAYTRDSQSLAPQPKLRKDSIKTELRLIVPMIGPHVAILPRSQGAKFLKGTDGFITLIKNDKVWQADSHEWTLERLMHHSTYVGRISHSITNHAIKADVFKMEISAEDAQGATILPPGAVEGALVSNLDRKAWTLLTRTP